MDEVRSCKLPAHYVQFTRSLRDLQSGLLGAELVAGEQLYRAHVRSIPPAAAALFEAIGLVDVVGLMARPFADVCCQGGKTSK